MMGALKSIADELQVRVYLETHSEELLDYYARFGFSRTNTTNIGGNEEITIHTMLREADI